MADKRRRHRKDKDRAARVVRRAYRAYRKGRRLYNSLTRVPKGTNALSFPNSMKVKLPMYDCITATTTSSPFKQEFQYCNLAKPLGNKNTQPKGFNYWLQLFKRWRVTGVKVLSFAKSLTSTADAIMGLAGRSGSTSQSQVDATLSDLNDDQFTSWRLVPYSGNSVVMKRYIKPWELLGISYHQYMNDDDYAGILETPPVKLYTLQTNVFDLADGNDSTAFFYGQNPDESTSTGMHMANRFTFYVIFDKPIDIQTTTYPSL